MKSIFDFLKIEGLDKKELAYYIPKMAAKLPHKYINSARPKAKEAINKFIFAANKLAQLEQSEAEDGE